MLLFLQWGVFSPTPNTQTGEPPLVSCPLLLIQYINIYPLYLEAFSSIRNTHALCRENTQLNLKSLNTAGHPGYQPPLALQSGVEFSSVRCGDMSLTVINSITHPDSENYFLSRMKISIFHKIKEKVLGFSLSEAHTISVVQISPAKLRVYMRSS
jgi:hypothetical protein